MHHACQQINLYEILVGETEGKEAIGSPDLHYIMLKRILHYREISKDKRKQTEITVSQVWHTRCLKVTIHVIIHIFHKSKGRSKAWVCGSSPAEIVGSNPAVGHRCLSVVSVVEVSATSRSLVQRSPTDCDALLCVI